MFSEALPNPPASKNLQFPIKPDSFSDPNLDRRMIWRKTSSQTHSQNHHGRANGFKLSQSPIFISLPQCALQSWGAYFWVITVLILQNSKFSQDDNIIYVPLASFSASKGNPRILSSCLTLFLGWINIYIYINIYTIRCHDMCSLCKNLQCCATNCDLWFCYWGKADGWEVDEMIPEADVGGLPRSSSHLADRILKLEQLCTTDTALHWACSL